MPKSNPAIASDTPVPANVYAAIIEQIFQNHYATSTPSFEFSREEITTVAAYLGVQLPKNVGDVIYSFRYRNELPSRINQTAKPGQEWLIEGAGRGRYRFRLADLNRIVPRAELLAIKIPDATPEIISAYALGDEQALLAKVRYNRLIDIFLGLAAYSLQNHLRTTVKGIGQIEIDEIYVGIDRHGQHFVIPVQAKGGADKHGAVQTQQDFALCAQAFPHLSCRPISVQFMANNRIAIFELTVLDASVKVVDEKHYELVNAADISPADLARQSKH